MQMDSPNIESGIEGYAPTKHWKDEMKLPPLDSKHDHNAPGKVRAQKKNYKKGKGRL